MPAHHVIMTADELRQLPAAIDLVTAGRALGMGRTKAHELARSGQFPCRLIRIGKRYRVITSELLELLGVDTHVSAA